MSEEREGKYCRVCGGLVPEGIDIRTILIDGKATGINQLDRILEDVAGLGLSDGQKLREELLRRVRAFNYIPSKKEEVYAEALIAEYRRRLREHRED